MKLQYFPVLPSEFSGKNRLILRDTVFRETSPLPLALALFEAEVSYLWLFGTLPPDPLPIQEVHLAKI